MTLAARACRRLLQAAWTLTLVGAGPAGAAPPAVPFEARATREVELFRKAKPGDEETAKLSPGHLLTVSRLEPEQTFKGEKALVAEVHPHAQSSFYTLLSYLEPVGPGVVVTDAEAGALLFPQVPAASRAWCQRFTQRLLLPASAGAGKGGALIYSVSSDDACAGYMALVSGTGKAARARALPRRGPLHSVTVHEVAGEPPLLEVVTAVREPGVSGERRLLLSLQPPTPKELLVVDTALDRLKPDTRHSITSTVTMTPVSAGLDIAVRRTETQVVLATGAEKPGPVSVKRYRYVGGKLTALPAAGGK